MAPYNFQVFFCCNPDIHDNYGFLPPGIQLAGNLTEHIFKSFGLAYIAIVKLAVPDKTQAVDR